jgi:hypothetical protein
MFEVVMAKGRRLKKVGSDLEVQKQSVPSSELRIWEQNVVPSKSRINESNNGFSLELANDEIIPKID